MENAAKALGIAAGVLLAVILMSLIAYFFSNLSEWPQQQDDMESAEQLAKFNKEYEVYEKSQMYGVDVISCLNKAKSNNEKSPLPVRKGDFLRILHLNNPYVQLPETGKYDIFIKELGGRYGAALGNFFR